VGEGRGGLGGFLGNRWDSFRKEFGMVDLDRILVDGYNYDVPSSEML
jgi:hypothetical protein